MFHKDDMEPALEIMAEVRAYFQDNVPKEIDTDFVRVIDTDLDLALRYLDLSEAQCREWLKEPPPVTDRRNELTGKKNRLDAAQAKLTEFFRSNRPDLA
ncbi:hypothetical protein FRB99_007342 [Tulasnella sp. 403]|nr:hypothetical protein FRB99_007342 [Tulasnella sp. 403]